MATVQQRKRKDAILALLQRPELTYREIAERVGVCERTVHSYAVANGLSRWPGGKRKENTP